MKNIPFGLPSHQGRGIIEEGLIKRNESEVYLAGLLKKTQLQEKQSKKKISVQKMRPSEVSVHSEIEGMQAKGKYRHNKKMGLRVEKNVTCPANLSHDFAVCTYRCEISMCCSIFKYLRMGKKENLELQAQVMQTHGSGCDSSRVATRQK